MRLSPIAPTRTTGVVRPDEPARTLSGWCPFGRVRSGGYRLFRQYWPLLISLAVGAALRIHFLLIRGTFWFDEAFSAHFSTLPSWRDTWHFWTLETNPPLYTLFLRGYLSFVNPSNELLVRLPSLFFGLSSIVALYFLGKSIYGRKTAFFASFLLAVSQTHIIMSTEARSYALLTLLAILSTSCFYRIFIKKDAGRGMFFLAFIVNLLFIYTHLTAIAAIAAQAIALIALRLEKKLFRRWIIGHAAVIVLWLPWLIPAALSKFNTSIGSAWFFDPGLTASANILTPFISAFANGFGLMMMQTILGAVIIAGIFIWGKKMATPSGDQRTNIFLGISAGLPLVAAAVIGVQISKYHVVAHGALFLIAGRLIDLGTATRRRIAMAIAAVVLLIGQTAVVTAVTPAFSSRPILQFIESHETPRTIVLLPFGEVLPLTPYYRGRAPMVGIYMEHDAYSQDERIVRHNWYAQNIDDETLGRWLDERIAEYHADKIFLIQNTGSYDRVHTLLTDRGWTKGKKLSADGYFFTTYLMYEFTAPKNAGCACTPSN